MELNSILLLVIILFVICSLTYFINIRQKRQLMKNINKQEPRFDVVTRHTMITDDSDLHEHELEDTSKEEPQTNMLLDDPLLQSNSNSQCKQNTEQETIKKSKAGEEVLYLILSAKNNKPYVGYELLQALLTAGLRYGPMNIFHRHEDLNGNGKILFSVAAANEPGTFEISKMGAFSGKGLVMFLKLSCNKDIMNAFDLMLDTAKQLIEDLDGDILDDERKALTNDKIDIMRKKILEFEQRQLMGDLFEQ